MIGLALVQLKIFDSTWAKASTNQHNLFLFHLWKAKDFSGEKSKNFSFIEVHFLLEINSKTLTSRILTTTI